MIIFLDIDGVLNTSSDWKNKYTIRPDCVKALAEICRQMQCTEIVLSSTWRVCNGDNEPEFYRNLKSMLAEYGLIVAGTTPVSRHTREEEILYYARRHECGQYLILDDDPSLFQHPDAVPLYVVNYKTGLSASDVKPVLNLWKGYWHYKIS